MPPLGSQWDVAGHGRWEDALITVEQLSSGLTWGKADTFPPHSCCLASKDVAYPIFNGRAISMRKRLDR
ncbi:hypothetical protein [Candidatus Symbiopectobacterium sp. 'North America']|uniref:hypothetical protein n=1 Tax=Candidatus Symbiopectobacterium sp. 'North America' TaxID=2794574 RepID=UPI001FD34E22|nr:hypothetical protein [Candidatus Symbiopectobacterium sp. 'North America']